MASPAAKIKREVAHHKTLPYTREFIRNADGTWFARILEFPGCMIEGETEAEAMEMLEDAMEGWLTAKLEETNASPNRSSKKILVENSSSARRRAYTVIWSAAPNWKA